MQVNTIADKVTDDIRDRVLKQTRRAVAHIDHLHAKVCRVLMKLRRGAKGQFEDCHFEAMHMDDIQEMEDLLLGGEPQVWVDTFLNVIDLDEPRKFLQEIFEDRRRLMDLVESNPKYQTDNPNDPRVRATVKDLTAGQCAYCDAELGDDWHVEHVVPKSAGGPDALANYVPSCKSCNSTKHARHVVEFIRNGKRYWRKPWETEEPVAINDVQPTLDAAE